MDWRWTLGIGCVFLSAYFFGPMLFHAMAKKDYDTLYDGIQNAKRAGGSYVQEEDRPYRSYSERYANGE